jgi:hypothetical protein
MVATVRMANRHLDHQDAALWKRASQAILGSSTLTEVLDKVGGFDVPGVSDADHARRAMDALPPSVGAAVLAALRSAVDRDLPVVIQWKPGVASEAQVWEVVEDGAGQIGVLIVTPYGRDLTSNS